MKKKYLKPVVEVHEMQLQGALLAGSSDSTKEFQLEEDNFEGKFG